MLDFLAHPLIVYWYVLWILSPKVRVLSPLCPNVEFNLTLQPNPNIKICFYFAWTQSHPNRGCSLMEQVTRKLIRFYEFFLVTLNFNLYLWGETVKSEKKINPHCGGVTNLDLEFWAAVLSKLTHNTRVL